MAEETHNPEAENKAKPAASRQDTADPVTSAPKRPPADAEALDALLRGGTAKPIADSSLPSQDDIDALISQHAAQASSAPEAPADGGAMDQAEIDALMSTQPNESPSAGGGVSQADIDALMAAHDAGDAEQNNDDHVVTESEPGGNGHETAAAAEADHESTPDEPDAPEAAPPPVPDAVPTDHLDAEGAGLDAVLGGSDMEAPLDSKELDAPIVGQSFHEMSLDQSDIDALLAGLDASKGQKPVLPKKEAPKQEAPKPAPPAEPEPVQEEAAPAPPAPAEEVGSENIAAAGTTQADMDDDGTLTDEALDALLTNVTVKERDEEPEASAPVPKHEARDGQASPEPAAAPKRSAARRRPWVGTWDSLKRNGPKISLSLAAGMAVALASFTYLYINQTQAPTPETLSYTRMATLDEAVKEAQVLMDAGSYAKVVDRLDEALQNAPSSPEALQARYLRLEAQFKSLPAGPVTPQTSEMLHSEIDQLVRDGRSLPLASEALRWKAALYEREDAPYAARNVYRELLQNYAPLDNEDQVLMDAAKNAMGLKRPGEAGEYLRRLLHDTPGSPLAPRAKLMLADSNAEAGETALARKLYLQAAQSQEGTKLGGEAYARLGELDYQAGDYDDAIQLLENRLQTATTVEGNDAVYLVLAKAYRAAGKPEEAERVLRELLDFFPESEVTPRALVELTQVLDDLGRRRDAVRLATQAVQRFPDNAAVLRNEGELLEASGDKAKAADALAAAGTKGSSDPQLLLAAARLYRDDKELQKALDLYDQLQENFPSTPQAFEGGIERAKVQCDLGWIQKGVDSLENLAKATEGRPQQLPVLTALGDLYQSLGLPERAAEIYRKVAVNSNEPETLAKTAVALLDAGATDDGLAVADRVSPAQLQDATAYSLLMHEGETLRRIDTKRAVDMMETAWQNYPEQRKEDDAQRLLEGYLASDLSARARALVMDLDGIARRDPAAVPRMQRAAVTWGDYLYDRGDYRAAADAYALAMQREDDTSAAAQWARFQRANALFALNDFDGSLALYDKIAQTSGAWSKAAGMKADYARLEQRLRGAEPASGGRPG